LFSIGLAYNLLGASGKYSVICALEILNDYEAVTYLFLHVRGR